MNVCHFLHAYLFPTENWCSRMIEHVLDTRVTIVTQELREPEKFPLPGARFLVPPLAGDTSGLMWPVRKAIGLARLVAHGWWRWRLPRRVRDADLFHAHFSIMGWQYLPLARKTKKPLVVSFYGYDYEWIPRNLPEWSERYRRLFAAGALFVTEGTAGRDKLIGQGCSAEKIRVVHLGVDVAAIPFAVRPKRPNELSLIQVATFSEKKGHEVTVNAFIAAAPACPGMTLTLVGKDPDGIAEPLRRAVRAAGLESRVTFLDFVAFAELYRFLRDYQVFVHPSRHTTAGDSEGGAPIVLLDAQATGMPVISTRHCDIPDEVIDGKTGILAAEHDVDAIANAMRAFYAMDATAYESFARAARAHVEANYEIQACADRLRAVYGELLARPSP